MNNNEMIVDEKDNNTRIDAYIAKNNEALTRSAVQRLCGQGHVFVNSKTVNKNYKISTLDKIEINIPSATRLENSAPENIPLDIIFEDSDILVVNKPKGMVVHPAAGNYSGTLVNALLYHCKDNLSGIGGVIRPGIVHRIDKNTSGLLIVAKNDKAHLSLCKQIKNHDVEKIYNAVVIGNIKKDLGTIDLPIGRNKIRRKQMCVTYTNSKNALTHYEVIHRYRGFTHIKINLQTGRTHQIRVHMQHIGNPIAGDDVYGPKKFITQLNGQCLHAKEIAFTHPTTDEHMYFDTPLPNYFQNFLNKLST